MGFLKRKDLVFAYGQILLGCLIGGAAYPLFMTPNNIAPGGVTGIGVILNYLFGLPVGTVSLVLNVPLFITGYRYMGRIFAFRSLQATALFSVLMACVNKIAEGKGLKKAANTGCEGCPLAAACGKRKGEECDAE